MTILTASHLPDCKVAEWQAKPEPVEHSLCGRFCEECCELAKSRDFESAAAVLGEEGRVERGTPDVACLS